MQPNKSTQISRRNIKYRFNEIPKLPLLHFREQMNEKKMGAKKKNNVFIVFLCEWELCMIIF